MHTIRKRITWIAVFVATGADENPWYREGQSHPATCTGRDIQTDESRTIAKKLEFHTPDTIGAYYREKCRFLSVEKTFLLLLTNAHTLIKEVELSSGTVNQTYLSPREIFIHALRYEAVHIVLVHNHPSGRVTPSEADIQSTLRIRDAGQLLGIQVSDHIIVAGDHYLSMLERGIL